MSDALSDSRRQKRLKVQHGPTHNSSIGFKKETKNSFTNVPVEIFNEIVANLGPADLLSLARSSKDFRRMLMSRTSRRRWQVAFDNVPGLPPCPSGLCEPQYASLLYSETCSTCGTRVICGMDPMLRVRLCSSCFQKEAIKLGSFVPTRYENLIPAICISRPQSISTLSIFRLFQPYVFHIQVWYTLQSQLKYVERQITLVSDDQSALARWVAARNKKMKKWRKHAEVLGSYLEQFEVRGKRELEEQEQEVETRLVSVGWTKRDMQPAPANRDRWNEIVRGPGLFTDSNWTRMYPALVLLLWSNRAYHQPIDRKARRDDRITRLNHLITDIRESLALLHRVTIQSGSRHTPASSGAFVHARNRSTDDSDPSRRDTVLPFPSMLELLELPIIKKLLEKDTDAGDFEVLFRHYQPKVEQAIEGWRAGAERRLLSILNSSCSGSNSGDKKHAGEAGVSAVIHIPAASAFQNIKSLLPPNDTALPTVLVTFPQPDGTYTSAISNLSHTTRTLLRADTRFIWCNKSINYPAMLYPPDQRLQPFAVANKTSFGMRWDASPIMLDEQGSAICRRLLVDLGCPNATHAEMSIIGNNFKCGRCDKLPTIWEAMVGHYRKEHDRWKLAQAAHKDQPGSLSIVYNNIHDLRASKGKPLVRLISPKASHDYLNPTNSGWMDSRICRPCGQVGLYRSYQRAPGGTESPLARHLRDVHNEYRAIGSSFRPG